LSASVVSYIIVCVPHHRNWSYSLTARFQPYSLQLLSCFWAAEPYVLQIYANGACLLSDKVCGRFAITAVEVQSNACNCLETEIVDILLTVCMFCQMLWSLVIEAS